MAHTCVAVAALFVAILFIFSIGEIQCQVELPVNDPNSVFGDSYSNSVATLNGVLIIGSPTATRGGIVSRGLVSIFRFNSSTHTHTFDGDYMLWNAGTQDDFGQGVCIFQSSIDLLVRAVVGVPYRLIGGSPQAGIAQILQQRTSNPALWDNTTILAAHVTEASSWFGWATAGSGDTILIGAQGSNVNGTQSGIAYLFGQNVGGLNNWGYKKSLTPSDAVASALFVLLLLLPKV